MKLSRLSVVAFAAALSTSIFTTYATAGEKIKIGAVRLVSSAPLYVAKEKGYFEAEGLDADLVFFEAAQPIAVAITSGDLDFGVSGLTAGFFNLAGKGAIKIIAGQYSERKGYDGNTILVTKKAEAAGFKSAKDFPGHSLAITQVGSSFHYMIAQIARKEGFDLAKVSLKPLQSVSNATNAFIGGQVDAFIAPINVARDLTAKGEAVSLGPFSDFGQYQVGVAFTSTAAVQKRRETVEKFVPAYQKGARDYADALINKEGSAAQTDAIAGMIAKYVYPAQADGAAQVKASALYVDPEARLDVGDIYGQVAFFKELKLVDPSVDAKTFIDLSFVKGHLNVPKD